MNRLSKTDIEYLTACWHFFTGCEHWKTGVCAVGANCWAKRTTERFVKHYPNGFEPTFYPHLFTAPVRVKEPARIGVAFMGDLGGDWINTTEPVYSLPCDMKGKPALFDGYFTLPELVFSIIEESPQHQFFFLSKNPAAWKKWGRFPDNCWVGFSGVNARTMVDGLDAIQHVNALHKWVSVEPLYSELLIRGENLTDAGIEWLTVGAQSSPSRMPVLNDLIHIVRAAQDAGIPYWLKNNLKDFLAEVAPSNFDFWSTIATLTNTKDCLTVVDPKRSILKQELPT